MNTEEIRAREAWEKTREEAMAEAAEAIEKAEEDWERAVEMTEERNRED